MIESVTYTGEQSGPSFLVLGAVHGNEKCGTIAIKRVIQEIESGQLKITCGKVTFVPICNPRAYEQDVRFTERNLNRYLVPMEKPDTYEAQLGNFLCPILAQCDVLLDIHSYSVGGEAFVSVGRADKANFSFSKCLGTPTLMTGWEGAYATTGRGAQTSDEEATGTTEYALRHKATVAVTLECGQHKDEASPHIAYRAIHNALRYLGMTKEGQGEVAPDLKPRHLCFTHVFYRDHDGSFPKPWRNFEFVKKDDVLGQYVDGTKVVSPADGYIIMPKANTPIGEEWFYLAVEKPLL